MNSSQLAKHLGCSKGYVSQLLNGNFDHKLSKLVELSLAIGKAPILEYKDVSEYILENDETFSSVLTSSATASRYDMPVPVFSSNNKAYFSQGV